jgi:hypothetical protein
MAIMSRRAIAIATMSFVALASCSSAGDGASSPTDSPTTSAVATTDATSTIAVPVTTEAPTTTAVPATTEAVAVTVGEWQAVPGGPDCKCSDGSPFELWQRPADPTKVMLFFEGGGACFSAETCGPNSKTYKRNLRLGITPDRGGIFDETNPENPIADWSIVFVPYCTGDVHLGDAVREYSDTVTIDHNGFDNADWGLQTVLADYPDVEQLLVAGSSAGSIPTPAFAGLAADVLPAARIVTFGDSSAAYPDVPALNVAIGGLWGVLENVPDWPVNQGLAPQDWSMPGLYVQAGTQHSEITFARFDFAYDQVQTAFRSLGGSPPADLLASIEQSEREIEAAGVPVASYIAPGTAHTILGGDVFYDMEVEGVRLVDFFATLIAGDVPDDVRCVECERPA